MLLANRRCQSRTNRYQSGGFISFPSDHVLVQETMQGSERHIKIRETPVPIYIGLTLMTMRAKTVIQRLFSLGICISYQRRLQILNNIASMLLNKFDLEKVLVGNSRLNQFTIIAKDNIDNAKSTKVEFHYHSFMLMQFLTELFIGESQETLYDLSKQPTSKLQLPESYSNFKELPFKTNAPLYSAVPTYKVDDIFGNEKNTNAVNEKIQWLEQVFSSNVDKCNSWSKHHSARVTPSSVYNRNSFDVTTDKQESRFCGSTASLHDDHSRYNL